MIDPPAAEWDSFVRAHPDCHTLQTSAWGAFKTEFGWSSQIVAVTVGGAIRAGALVLYKRVHRLIPLAVAYIPCGPLLAEDDAANAALWSTLDRTARKRGAVFLKVEPCDWYRKRAGLRDLLIRHGFRQSRQTIQPPRTVVLDLSGTDADVLARMNQSTRYKAKLGPKKEVETRFGTLADVASFTALMGVTGARDNFGTHAPEYYRRAFELFAPGERCALILASHAGQDLAGVMVFHEGDKAYYLYGASSNAERNRMPTYIAQWAAIRWAKERGVRWYDLWGLPDADEAQLDAEFETREDGLWGVYGFKRGWGGRVVRSVGAWDRVYLSPVYALYERLLNRREG